LGSEVFDNPDENSHLDYDDPWEIDYQTRRNSETRSAIDKKASGRFSDQYVAFSNECHLKLIKNQFSITLHFAEE